MSKADRGASAKMKCQRRQYRRNEYRLAKMAKAIEMAKAAVKRAKNESAAISSVTAAANNNAKANEKAAA
jgi:hypothetical protein